MQELAIAFVWNTDNKEANDIVAFSQRQLSRDAEKPFSRSLDIPMFFYRSDGNTPPPEITVKANNVLIFALLDQDIAISDRWRNYINELVNLNECSRTIGMDISHYKIIPIALYTHAFSINTALSTINCIRAYEYTDFKSEYLFIHIAHEIYRYGFSIVFNDTENSNTSKTSILGTNTALKVFLSHTKTDKVGQQIALRLKKFFDYSAMNHFFDVYNIAPGYKFGKEIKNHIETSSMIIINSDKYSSRYWCQQEVLFAKEQKVPMIMVDALQEDIDRFFPYICNIPVVHVQNGENVTTQELLSIIIAILVETIRVEYVKVKFKRLIKISDYNLFYRPPEPFELQKLYQTTDEKCKVVYPDPPLYRPELKHISNGNIELCTPLSIKDTNIANRYIGISISDISNDELAAIGQNKSHLKKLSQTIARYLLHANAKLVYGGDLRSEDSFTEYLCEEARIVADIRQDDLEENTKLLTNYLAWPNYCRNQDQKEHWKKWKASHLDIVNLQEIPRNSEETITALDTREIFTNTIEEKYEAAKALSYMREIMIAHCDVRICAGGKCCGYSGKMPGVLEEVLIAARKKLPLFLLGGFGGITAKICAFLENTTVLPEELTKEWQSKNTSGYRELLQFYDDNHDSVDYETIIEQLRGISLCNNVETAREGKPNRTPLNNGLTIEENRKLFHTVYVEEAVELILKGLRNIYN